MGQAFSASVKKSVSKAVNLVTTDFAAKNLAECYSSLKQNYTLAIKNSNVAVTGDFKASQEAKMALSCIQEQKNSAQLMLQLENAIKKRLKSDIKKSLASFGTTDVQLSTSDISNIVNTAVKLDSTQSCIADISQQAAINIENSTVTVGACTQATLDANAQVCTAALETVRAGFDVSKDSLSACKAVADCAAKTGSFLVEQGLTFTGGCEQLQQISTSITQQLATKFDEEISTKERPFSFGTTEIIIIIVVGVVLMAIITALIAYFRAKAMKKKKQSIVSSGDMDAYMARGVEQPNRLGTSFESRA